MSRDVVCTFEHLSIIIGILIVFNWGISILLFGSIRVKHINREMVKEGIELPAWDKGIGGAIIMYAMVIVMNKAAKSSPIDDEAVLRHTRPKDYAIAVFLIISSIVFFIFLGAFYLFGPKG